MARPTFTPRKPSEYLPLITVEFKGSKGWEVGFEEYGRRGSKLFYQGVRYMAACEAEGLSSRMSLIQQEDIPKERER